MAEISQPLSDRSAREPERDAWEHRTLGEWRSLAQCDPEEAAFGAVRLSARVRQLRERVASLEVYAIVAARSMSEAGLALHSDEQSVAGAQATTEIAGRSWDPEAAGRRAVEKHGEALKRLSDEGKAT